MLTLTPSTQAAYVDGFPVDLTRAQYNMLVLLVRERRCSWRRLYSVQRRIHPSVPDDGINMSSNVRSHVKRIREKLREAGAGYDEGIRVISGFGYKWVGAAEFVESLPREVDALTGSRIDDLRVKGIIGRLSRGKKTIWGISCQELTLLMNELLAHRMLAHITRLKSISSSATGETPAGAAAPSGTPSPPPVSSEHPSTSDANGAGRSSASSTEE